MGSLSSWGHLLVTHGYYQLIAAACAPWFPAPGGLCPKGSVPSTTSPTSLGSCRLSTPRCFSSAPLGLERGWLGWVGWSYARVLSSWGRKAFGEEGDSSGPGRIRKVRLL